MTHPTLKKSDRLLLLILTPLVLNIALSMDIYVPSLLNIMQTFAVNEETVQWTLSVYMLGVGIMQLFCGPLSDQYGRKKVVIAGLAVYVVGTLICIFATSIHTLILGRFIQSTGSCTSMVIAYAVVKDLYSTERSASIFSYLSGLTMIAPILAPSLGGYLNIWFDSWRAAFIFLGLFGIFSIVICYLALPETLIKENRIKISFIKTLKIYANIATHKQFLFNAFYVMMTLIILFCFCAVSSFLLINTLGLTTQVFGLCFGSNAIFFVIGTVMSSRSTSMQRSIITGLLFLILGGGSMFLWHFYYGMSVLSFLMPMFIISLGLGFVIGPATASALAEHSHCSGSASGLLASIEFLGAGILGAIFLKNFTAYEVSFPLLCLLLGILSLFLMILHRQEAKLAIETEV